MNKPRKLHVEITNIGDPRIGIIYDPIIVFHPPKSQWRRCSREFRQAQRQSLEHSFSDFFEEGMPHTHLVLVTNKSAREIAKEMVRDFKCYAAAGTDRDGLYTFAIRENEAGTIIEGLRKNYEKYHSKET